MLVRLGIFVCVIATVSSIMLTAVRPIQAERTQDERTRCVRDIADDTNGVVELSVKRGIPSIMRFDSPMQVLLDPAPLGYKVHIMEEGKALVVTPMDPKAVEANMWISFADGRSIVVMIVLVNRHEEVTPFICPRFLQPYHVESPSLIDRSGIFAALAKFWSKDSTDGVDYCFRYQSDNEPSPISVCTKTEPQCKRVRRLHERQGDLVSMCMRTLTRTAGRR